MARKVIQVPFNDNEEEQGLLQYVEEWGYNKPATIKTIIKKFKKIEEEQKKKPAETAPPAEEEDFIDF